MFNKNRHLEPETLAHGDLDCLLGCKKEISKQYHQTTDAKKYIMIETTERYLKMINIVVQSRLTSCNKQRRDTSTNSFLFIFLFVGSVGGAVKCPPKHVQRKPNNAMREFFF